MKKTHSIQIQFLSIILSAMILVAVFIGGLSIYEVGKHVHSSTRELVTAKSEKEAVQINSVFDGMEKSVQMMESYVLGVLTNEADLTNPEKQAQVIDGADKLFAEIAGRTDGALSYYLRFAPEISGGVSGLYYSKVNVQDGFARVTPTDLSLYSKEDKEYVGWFWEPYETGTAVWLDPYRDRTGVLMISYVIPLYVGNRFIGVVGMDFDYNTLSEQVSEIKIYGNGYAYLEKNGLIAYPEELAAGTPVPELSEEDIHVSQKLSNGMRLVVFADYDDIKQLQYNIGRKILGLTAGLTLLFLMLIVLMVGKLVKPLRKLTKAAEKLADNDYDIEVVHSKTREIELLSTTFEHMAAELREHDRLQHQLAYRDSLTGLRNANSYEVWATDFDQEIKKNAFELFGVMLLDINNLKDTNDRFGHDVGNKLIVKTAQMIAGIFKRSPVFRIGGDEFLIILQARDLQSFAGLLHKFQIESENATVSAEGEEIPVSVAYGTAIYDPEQDESFVEVFNRADDAMYKKKREMKESAPALD